MVASCAQHSSTSGSRFVHCSFRSWQFTIFFCVVRRSEAGTDSKEAMERGATAVKQRSDGNEAMEGGGTATLHRGVKGSRGRQGGALCQPWAALQRIQVDPDFNSLSLFVVYIGVRQAITIVQRGAWSDGSAVVKQWSDGDAAEDSKE